MNEFTFYLLKMVAGSGVMYLGYKLWLGNNQSVGLMRGYLLASLVVPAILPLIDLTVLLPESNLPVVRVALLPETVITAQPSGGESSLGTRFIWLYLSGCTWLFVLFVMRLAQISNLIIHSKSIRFNYLKLHLSAKNITPFSFFSHILVSKPLIRQGNLRPIIIHEAAHIRQGHSYDIIFTELISMLLWFNPFVWLFRKAIQQNHEFLADREVVRQHCNTANYKALLLESLTGVGVPVVNNFNHSSLKKRFIMLNKPFSGRDAYVRALAGVILLIITVTAAITSFQKDSFALTNGGFITNEVMNSSSATPSTLQPPSSNALTGVTDDTTLFQVVEQMPEFPGGQEALSEYFSKSIVYPEEARKKGVKGSVIVNFVIETDGSVSGAKVQRGIGSGCDEAAVKTISSMPKWKPGMQRGKAVRVSMNMPVRFSLSGAKTGFSPSPEQMKPNEEGIFQVVEVMPEFPGGDEARMEYLRQKMVYPDAARKAGIEGTVYVTFVVQEDGSIAKPKILRGIDKECDEVVLTMMKQMPRWQPGTQRGKPVKVQFNMPVKFVLNKEKTQNK